MNKNRLLAYVDREVEGLPLREQVTILQDLAERVIPEMIAKKIKEYTQCPKCREYSRNESFRNFERKECREQHVQIDGPENTKIVLAEFIVKYSECPVCKHARVLKRVFVKAIGEKEKE